MLTSKSNPLSSLMQSSSDINSSNLKKWKPVEI